MAKCDCNHDKHWHQGHPGKHNYDPTEHHHPHPAPFMIDKCADQCDDQLPLFSQVGRGLQGDGYKVQIKEDGLTKTILEGLIYDPRTGAFSTDWASDNINGGHLFYQYNLRPFTDPQTFTITFKYVRDGKGPDGSNTVWSWTTPAIPYLWSRQPDGSMSDGEDIVGSGVATLYLKKTTEGAWDWRKHEKLVYPDGFTHEDMNTPEPEEGWTVNIQYGIGGDIDAPNIEDLAKILGITVNNIRNIIQNSPEPTAEIPDDNLKEYIDRRDKEIDDHIHEDMGFGDLLINDGNADTHEPKRNTIKKWLDWIIAQLGFGGDINNFGDKGTTIKQYIDQSNEDLENKYKKSMNDLLKVIYGGGTFNPETGAITLNTPGKIAVGNLNVFTNINGNQSTVDIPNANGTNTTNVDPNYIMTRNPANGDVRSV